MTSSITYQNVPQLSNDRFAGMGRGALLKQLGSSGIAATCYGSAYYLVHLVPCCGKRIRDKLRSSAFYYNSRARGALEALRLRNVTILTSACNLLSPQERSKASTIDYRQKATEMLKEALPFPYLTVDHSLIETANNNSLHWLDSGFCLGITAAFIEDYQKAVRSLGQIEQAAIIAANQFRESATIYSVHLQYIHRITRIDKDVLISEYPGYQGLQATAMILSARTHRAHALCGRVDLNLTGFADTRKIEGVPYLPEVNFELLPDGEFAVSYNDLETNIDAKNVTYSWRSLDPTN